MVNQAKLASSDSNYMFGSKVGHALQASMRAGVERKDLFVTSKPW